MRTAALAVPLALAAAGLYAVTGAITSAHDQPTVFADPLDYVLEWVFVVGLVATAGALSVLARAGAGVGAWLATAGHVVLLVAATATAVEGREALDPLFPLGILAIMAGYVVLAVRDARRRLVLPGLGAILLLGWVANAVVDATAGAGGLVLAATWAGVAHLAGARDGRVAATA